MKSTYELIQAGITALRAEHAKHEVLKKGVLRAGNTGVVLSDGSVVGKCARQTYLRLVGIDADVDDASRELMFAAGRTNEDSWKDLFIRAGIPESFIRCEDEVPIHWTTKSGRSVTGRPDLVIGEWTGVTDKATWRPIKGIELKLVSSVWTGRDVALKGQPKSMHLMQAAHYSWKLGVPFELWYTARADFAIGSGWEQKNFPNMGMPGSEFIEYNEKGGKKKLKPFIVGYELAWNEKDELQYRRIGPYTSPWTLTFISKKGIEDYFELVDDLAARDMKNVSALPPRPLNLNPTGDKEGYSICSYCPMEKVCDSTEKFGLKKWVQAAEEWSKQLPVVGSLLLDSKPIPGDRS